MAISPDLPLSSLGPHVEAELPARLRRAVTGEAPSERMGRMSRANHRGCGHAGVAVALGGTRMTAANPAASATAVRVQPSSPDCLAMPRVDAATRFVKPFVGGVEPRSRTGRTPDSGWNRFPVVKHQLRSVRICVVRFRGSARAAVPQLPTALLLFRVFPCSTTSTTSLGPAT